MTLHLQIPKELAERLNAEAQKLGVSIDEYALRILMNGGSDAQTHTMSGAEAVAHWRREGVVGSRSDIGNSQDHARQVRDQAQMRRRAS